MLVSRWLLCFLLTLPFLAHSKESLPENVQAALQHHNLSQDGISIFVQSLDTGQEILSYRPDQPRNPASTMKVVTGLAALETLSPSYRWVTRIYSEEPPENGVVKGDLYLVGGGDPYLVQERLWLMLKALKRQGVHTIQGDLVIDDSLFVRIDEDTGAFDNQPFRIYNALPSAVLTNFNSIRFLFEPGPGSSVTISSFPELDSLKIDNKLRTVNQACRGYRRGIALSMQKAETARFDGRFPARCTRYGFTRSVLPPLTYTGDLFRTTWRTLDGTLNGNSKPGNPPEDAHLILEFESVTLAEATRLMNKHSSNLIARHLILTMGGEKFGWPATEEQGLKALDLWLDKNDLDFPEMVVENGAGRSRTARISARSMTQVIRTGWQSRYMPEFISSLSLLGHDGTLGDRHTRGRLNGRAHLKTGRLDHVTGITGILHKDNGRRYALTVLHNDTDVHHGLGESIQDSILQYLQSVPDQALSAAP